MTSDPDDQRKAGRVAAQLEDQRNSYERVLERCLQASHGAGEITGADDAAILREHACGKIGPDAFEQLARAVAQQRIDREQNLFALIEGYAIERCASA